MDHTRWNGSLGRKARRVALAGVLGFCGWGCQHHHYYYYGNPPAGTQGCPPGTTIMPSTVTPGPICEVPADSAVGANSSRSTIISDGRKSRVVVSEPSSGRSSSFGWRPSDPEAPSAVTQVDGALDDSKVKR